MQYSYLLVDEAESLRDTLVEFEGFPEYFCAGTASSKEEAVNKILELQPSLVFIEVSPKSKKNNLSLSIITELYQFIDSLPYFIVITSTTRYAYDAIKSGVGDYLLKPLNHFDIRKALLKFEKTSPTASTLTICTKSYAD